MSDILKPIVGVESLSFALLPVVNGLAGQTGCQCYLTDISIRNLVNEFQVEAGSDIVDENEKMQRDVDKSRVNALKAYLINRPDYCLPPLTVFVNKIDIVSQTIIAGRTISEAILKPESHRFICDGQGRTYSLSQVIESIEGVGAHSIGLMVIVTNTNSILDARQIIRQLFADVNGKTKKPSTSLSLSFDSSVPFSRLINQLGMMDVPVGLASLNVSKLSAKQGRIRKGHLWTHKQFSGFVSTMIGAGETDINKSLGEQDEYERALAQCELLIRQTFSRLPLIELQGDSWKEAHDKSLYTKAVFAKGLALTVRCLIAEAVKTGKVEWSKLDGLIELPICDLGDTLWREHKITEQLTGKVRITKGCHGLIARVLCYHLDIKPTPDL